MIRKIIMTLSIVGILSFVSCGDSSKEAKALLQKILQFVGIPSSIVVQVCQDANIDSICNLNEAKTKVNINKGDSLDDILEKVSLTEDGRFFLETYNPELPILVELQDRAKVDFDEGKFTLVFNGFKTKEDDNETKEISILESMVDANALSKSIADTFRTLDNAEAQEKYYVALLDTLESNINILRRQGLDSQTAVRASIQEMGDESTTNKGQANRINTCSNDQVCVDREIKILADELLITEGEALEIKQKQEENNNLNQNNNSNQNKIDMAKYMPSSSITKNFISSNKIDELEEQIFNYSESFTVNDNVISQQTDSGTLTTTIKEDTIVTIQPDNKRITYPRYSQIGDVLYTIPLDSTINDQSGGKTVTTGEMVCTLEAKMNEFSSNEYTYVGDILKVNCVINSTSETTTTSNSDFTSIVTTKGNSIQYTQEGISLITAITDYCSESNLLPEVCVHGETYYLK